ncbi:zinc finger, CCHC-type containing protein [Tanacetum coccineum]
MSSKPAENMSTHAEQAQTFLLPNNATVLTSSEAAQSKTHLFLNELTNGVTRTIIVMVCPIWDVHAVTGRYLSTDFVGDAIHCTAKANIARNFLKLKEGSVYSIKDFVVQGNKDEYRIFKDHAFIRVMRSSLDFNKKFYNSLGRAPNRCSSSIDKTQGVVNVHSRNRLGMLDHGLTEF